MRKQSLLLASLAASSLFGLAQVSVRAADGPYHLLKEIPVGGEGGWDYASVDPAARRLYVSHGDSLVVIDLDKEKIVGEITNTLGVHGLAPAPDLGRGFASCGRENKAAIVDLKRYRILDDAGKTIC